MTAEILANFLRDIDDPRRAVEIDDRVPEGHRAYRTRTAGHAGPKGYTGLEGLLNYVYYQTGADEPVRPDRPPAALHRSTTSSAGPCGNFSTGHDPQTGAPGVPAKGGGTTTNILDAADCVGWLGPNQPGLNQDLGLPRYDPSVCPNGTSPQSAQQTLCDPARRPRPRRGPVAGRAPRAAAPGPARRRDPRRRRRRATVPAAGPRRGGGGSGGSGRGASAGTRLRPDPRRHPRPAAADATDNLPREPPGRARQTDGTVAAAASGGGARRPSGGRPATGPPRLPVRATDAPTAQRENPSGSIAASPTMVGAVTTLIVVVAVFLAYNANAGLPFVPVYRVSVEIPDGRAPDRQQRGPDRRQPGGRRRVDRRRAARPADDGPGRAARARQRGRAPPRRSRGST